MFSEHFANAEIIAPYENNISFDDEKSAYQYFSKHVGIERYHQKLKEALLDEQVYFLIGFSVGASALWQFLASNTLNEPSHAIGFYGSQIRHMTQLSPLTSMALIMPSEEPHFSVKQTCEQLSHKANVTIEQNQYLHGFMNKLSTNFNDDGYQRYLNKLLSHYQNISKATT